MTPAMASADHGCDITAWAHRAQPPREPGGGLEAGTRRGHSRAGPSQVISGGSRVTAASPEIATTHEPPKAIARKHAASTSTRARKPTATVAAEKLTARAPAPPRTGCRAASTLPIPARLKARKRLRMNSG